LTDPSACCAEADGWSPGLHPRLPAKPTNTVSRQPSSFVTPNRDQLAELAALVDSGRVHVEIAHTFPLDKGREAFESGRRPGRRAGKTVIIVRP
jgi:NADPH:quinone reductase-like Zn-dependent oxidoreductase